MRTLLVGFDSAWASARHGAIVGALRDDEGRYCELGLPRPARFDDAEAAILDWQGRYEPEATVIMIDQPTIVKNSSGQRPVENIVASPVGRRYGGVQPANIAKNALFGEGAPVWRFLNRFGGPADPLGRLSGTWVVETYPVLTMIALGWTVSNERPGGRLPEYNPSRRKSFFKSDWERVCLSASSALLGRGLADVAGWLDDLAGAAPPRKTDQDCVDACICLLVALHVVEAERCLMVGNTDSGYIVAPFECGLLEELEERCRVTSRAPSQWVRAFSVRTIWDRMQETAGQTAATPRRLRCTETAWPKL